MTAMSSSAQCRHKSRLRRAINALPFLLLPILVVRAMAAGESIGPVIERAADSSVIELAGQSVPVIKQLYGVPVLDQLLSFVTIAFAHMQFNADARLYLQSMVFLTDWAGAYAILMLESCRKSNARSLFQFPLLFLFASQLIPVGVLAPLYFYALYVLRPLEDLSVASWQIDPAHAAAVLPATALTYLAPHLLSYLHPSLAARHWWNWVWQLYPVWGSMAFLVFSKAVSFAGTFREPQIRSIVRTTVCVLGATSTAIYWYAIYHSGWAAWETFIPMSLFTTPQAPLAALHLIIQCDHISSIGAGLLWLAYSLTDLWQLGMAGVSTMALLFAASGIGVALGPGTLMLVAWIVREEAMGTGDEGKAKLL